MFFGKISLDGKFWFTLEIYLVVQFISKHKNMAPLNRRVILLVLLRRRLIRKKNKKRMWVGKLFFRAKQKLNSIY